MLPCPSPSHFLTVIQPCDVVRGPLHFVSVPFILWIMLRHCLANHLLILPDNVCVECTSRVRRYELDIKFTPASCVPSLSTVTLPPGKEWWNCTWFVISLNSSDEFTVLVCLLCSNWSWTPLLVSLDRYNRLYRSYECKCVLHLCFHLLLLKS